MRTTPLLKPAEIKPGWWVIDATDVVVGRMAARVAQILMGKHRPDYTPHVATGDFVVVINAEKVKFTGDKWAQKVYDRYTGYPSGRRTMTAAQLRDRKPEVIIEHAIKRMLPKNKLANVMFSRLKVYAGGEHPHQAQQPQSLTI